ncbi:MAG TPA: DUF3616 domain-containing protein [Lamprocystis sp. (in: g-proteobacteria)]|nr:DUF3616 domain-containing protein [Lamprocystis sp. (in: g-proteobacteria)]
MQSTPIGQVLLRLDPATDAAAGPVSAIALDGGGTLWLGAAALDGIRRLVPQGSGAAPAAGNAVPEGSIWGQPRAVDLGAMFELPDPGDPMDLTGMACAGDRLWFVGSHRGRRLDLDPALSDAQNLNRLSRVEPIHRRACLGHARITATGLPQPRDLALLPIGDGGNHLTRALVTDPHLGPSFTPRLGPLAGDARNACDGPGLAGLAYNAGRLWIGLSAPVLGGFAVLLEIEPREQRRCILGLQPIGVDGRPYRKHLVQINGLGVQALRWHGDSLLILAGGGADGAAGEPGIYELREASKLRSDSLTLADDPRLGLLLPLAEESTPGGGCPRAMELYDGLGQPGVMVVPGDPGPTGRGAPAGVVADIYALNGYNDTGIG